jgi:hypothetical protein
MPVEDSVTRLRLTSNLIQLFWFVTDHDWRNLFMLVKRLVLAAISIGVGFGLTILITMLIGTTPAEYGAIYMIFTTLSLAVALGIWLDKFMGTQILPK